MVKFKNPHCHVYFSAPSGKLSQRRGLFDKIVSAIEEAGGSLTLDWLNDKTKLSPKEIFKQAIEGIKVADILVAEITFPSTGVGQQIALALSWKIPVIALLQKGKKISSRFTVGSESELVSVVRYEEEQLPQLLKEKFGDVFKKRFVKFNFISTREINQYLQEESNSKGISKSQFLRHLICSHFRTR